MAKEIYNNRKNSPKDREPSFTEFIDFSNKIGTTKITKVNSILENTDYKPYKDYYKPLREFVIESLCEDELLSSRDEFLNKISKADKREHFKSILKGFERFKRGKALKFFPPPFTFWTPDDRLRVRINPEVGLLIDGKPNILKIHFNCKKESVLRNSAAKCMIRLMEQSLGDFYSDHHFGIWDIRRNKVFRLEQSDDIITLDGFLEGEAQSFIKIRDSLILKDTLVQQVA